MSPTNPTEPSPHQPPTPGAGPGAGPAASTVVTFTRSRVLRGLEWVEQQHETDAELEARLRADISARGLIVDDIGEVLVEVGMNSTWARLTRTATAHSQPHDQPGDRPCDQPPVRPSDQLPSSPAETI